MQLYSHAPLYTTAKTTAPHRPTHNLGGNNYVVLDTMFIYCQKLSNAGVSPPPPPPPAAISITEIGVLFSVL